MKLLNTKLLLSFYFFIALGLLNIGQTSAQTYVPFPDSNAVWAAECCQGFQCENHGYANYWVGNEDTVIGGKNYNMLYIDNSNPLIYIGAYRNDTAVKKVYYVDSADTSEILLYDFSLEVGDTFQIPYPNGLCSDTAATLFSIDSVLVGSEYRRRFNFSTVTVYEGIGSIAGLFEYYAACFEYQCNLRCFKSGDTIILGNPTSCNLATDGINESGYNENTVQIHPNPLTNNSILELTDGMEAQSVTVYNILGQEIAFIDVAGKAQLTFDRNDFNKGWYTFIITGKNNKKLHYGKFTVL